VRVILVGSAEDRRRLRARVPTSIEIVGEVARPSDARTLLREVDADALLSAASRLEPRSFDEDDVVEPLTRREIDVLTLMAEGLPNKAIGTRLGISDQTVKFHVAAICGKLDAANRTEAVRRALHRGLVPL
jgi:ATP/maltotriose-dependent transcriptional regulator MalT